jgi:TP901 family phage tail tape measure protein
LANEDIILTLGVDVSSIKGDVLRAANEAEKILKSQKLIANIAYQTGMSQGAIRKQFQKVVDDGNAYFKNNAAQLIIDAKIAGEDNLINATQNLPRLRYALYDVSNATQQASQALLAFAETSVVAAAKYETAFTAVERTTDGLAQNGLNILKEQLIGISTQLPLAFADITNIASLGAQLGVANSDLAGFTKNVAQFAAVTNVSTESAAQSFGALGELLNIQADQYANLGSAIAFAGVKSVATETEILAVATAIGGVAASADLTAQDVVALSTSLASLRVPAEQSRGALTRVFTEVNRAAAEGGIKLQNFASVLGISSEQAQNLAKTDMSTFFNQFVAGLSGMSSGQLTQTLDALSLSDIRVTNTLSRLSNNLELVKRNQDIVNQSFADGTFLSVAYGSKVDDIASKFQILINSFNNLAATAGTALTPILGPIIDFLTRIAVGFNIILSGPGGQVFAGIAIGAAALGAALFGLISVVALSTAGIYAFKTAFDGLSGSGSVLDNGLTRLIAKMVGIDVAAKQATTGVAGLTTGTRALAVAEGAATAGANGFKIALASTGIGLAVVALGTLASAFMAAGSSANITNGIFADTSGLANALSSDTAARTSAIAASNYELANSYVELKPVTDDNTASIKSNYDAMVASADVLGIVGPSYDALNAAVDSNTQYLGDNTTAWIANRLMQNETFQSIAQNADFKKYAKAVEFNLGDMLKAQATRGKQGVIDYFNELEKTAIAKGREFESILSRVGRSTTGKAGVLRIDSSSAGSAITTLTGLTSGLVDASLLGSGALNGLGSSGSDAADGLNAAGNAAGGAAEKIRTLEDYANDLSSVFKRAFDIRFSSQSTLDDIASSFNKIAEATAKAAEELNSLNADIGKLTADKALNQYFLSVAEAYGDTIRAAKLRAEIAKIDSDLTKKNQALTTAQNKTNKTLVGSSEAAIDNRTEITGLVKSYQEHIKALAASGMSQEQLALKTSELRQDFLNQATALGYNSVELGTYAAAFDDVSVAIANVPRDITVTANTNPALQALNEFEAKARSLASNTYGGGTVQAPINESRLTAIGGLLDPSDVGITRRALEKLNPQGLILIGRQLYKQGWAEGGYTGAGGKYDVAGIVHRGEYVVPKEQVNQQTGTPYFMNQPRSFAVGGYAGGQATSMMVELSPTDRALLRSAGGSGEVVLYANNEAIARSSNAGNRQIVATGGRP